MRYSSYKQITTETITIILGNAPSKSYDLDPLPIGIVREFTTELAPILTKLVNMSMSPGELSGNLKEVFLRPLLKKNGLCVMFKNFRPVSNLSYSSKLRICCQSTADRIYKGIGYGAATTICLQIPTQYRNSTLKGKGRYPSCNGQSEGNLPYYVRPECSV